MNYKSKQHQERCERRDRENKGIVDQGIKRFKDRVTLLKLKERAEKALKKYKKRV